MNKNERIAQWWTDSLPSTIEESTRIVFYESLLCLLKQNFKEQFNIRTDNGYDEVLYISLKNANLPEKNIFGEYVYMRVVGNVILVQQHKDVKPIEI
jgi:hypothetical protein